MPRNNPPTGDPILDALRAERERRGLSQQQLARTIGRSTYQTTYQWESGATSPTLRCLREWAASLGYDVTLTLLDAQRPAEGGPEPDCGSCGDTGWALVGYEFNGNPVTEPCPACGAGEDRRQELDAEDAPAALDSGQPLTPTSDGSPEASRA